MRSGGEDERARWRADPVGFVRHWLGAAPWGKQREILEALRDNSYVAVRSCNGSGKTYIAAHAVIWWLLCYDDAVVITTAPTERQVSELLWREIRDIHAANKELIGGQISKTRLELGPRRFAFGFSTDQAERFQGFHQGHILLVVDEASGVDAKIFDAMEGSMTSRNSKMLLIGNPTALSGVFYDAFHKDRALWHTIHISAFDTPGLAWMDGDGDSDTFVPLPLSPRERGANERSDVSGVCTGGRGECGMSPHRQTASSQPRIPLRSLRSASPFVERKGTEATSQAPFARERGGSPPDGLITPEWVERAGKRWGRNSATYQVRVLGEFPAAATDTLIPLKHIEAAVERHFSDPSREEAVMGLDIARFGDDRSVACVRQGPAIVGLWVFPSSDIMATTGRALDLAPIHKVGKINVDEVGLGAGVLDRMREIGSVEAVGINGGRRASEPERYANLRAEMFDGLRLRFQSGDISICDDAELISELASLKYSFTSKGQMRLEDKQSLRSSGRRSPDKADAVMLAFAKSESNPLMIWI